MTTLQMNLKITRMRKTHLTDIAVHNQIRAELERAQRIVISAHIRPDGDAVGSMLGLAQALREQGKVVQTVLQDAVDPKYYDLAGAKEVQTSIQEPYDYLIVVDSADRHRVGKVLDGIDEVDLVIDHHISHVNFGKIDVVEPDMEATALVLYEFMPLWGLPLSNQSAECIMTGILADTIGFRTSNTSPKSLRAVADMMDMGINLSEIYFQTLSSRTMAELRYWAQGLTKIKYEDGLVWSVLTLEDRAISGYQANDDADLVNQLSSMQGASMAILFNEQPGESVKISWRAVPGIDVSTLASSFGGGGHTAAAGADVPGNLDDVMREVLMRSKAYLQNMIR